MRKYVLFICCMFSMGVNAQIAQNNLDKLDLTQIQRENVQTFTIESIQNISTENQHLPEIYEQDLLDNPQFLEQLLDSAIADQNIEGMRVLIPIYQKSSQFDEVLWQYACAIVAGADGDYSQAIDIYRKIVAQYPDLTPMRVRLVESLILDKQYQVAQQQIIKIQSDPTLPTEIFQQLQEAEQWLKSQQKWQMSANVHYLHDPNINQAPKHQHYAHWQLPKPVEGKGLAYNLNLYKNQSFLGNWSWRGGVYLDGESYWNAHAYDDVTVQAQLGVAYQNAQWDLAVLPLYGYRWFGTEPYSQEFGVRTQAQYHFNSKWHGFATVQYSQKRHQQRNFLDGWLWHNSFTALYVASPKQSWFVGSDFIQEKTQYDSDSYQRLGWEQEWRYGISTLSQVGVAKRDYAREDIFNIRRHDMEYLMRHSVWHRGLHWRGFTPKLSWLWQKVDSQHFLYDYHKNQVFFEIDKRF